MFAVLIAIAVILIFFNGIPKWIYENLSVIDSWLDYVRDFFDVITSVVPAWILPFVAISLALGILGLVVKLL